MDLQALIERIGAERFDEASRWAWRTAAGTGSNQYPPEKWPPEAADVPHDLADAIWFEGSQSSADRVALLFAVYRRMPCYANLMHVSGYVAEWDERTRQRFWGEVRDLVGDDDDRLADPITYSLWCDFFEDSASVDEAWAETAESSQLSERGLVRVLEVSGPVPFEKKASLYQRLMGDRRWHHGIFRSLVGSAFDVYGDVERQVASQILSRLDLPEVTPDLAELKRKLHPTTPDGS